MATLVWTESLFLKKAEDEAAAAGVPGLRAAQEELLSCLRSEGVEPHFDGKGDREATYTVRVAGENWHVLRVNASGEVIAMVIHFREHRSEHLAEFFTRQIRTLLRDSATGLKAPKLSTDAKSFMRLPYARIAWAARSTLDAAECFA